MTSIRVAIVATVIAFVSVIGLLVTLVQSPAPGPEVTGRPLVWVESSLTRVGLGGGPGTGTTATLSAARAETESFQVVVSGGSRTITGVDLEVSALRAPDGTTIPREAMTLYREQYVTASRGSPVRGGSNPPSGTGPFADGLVPFVDPVDGSPLNGEIPARNVTVEAGENQPFWVDVSVPREAAAGTYSGTFRVTSDQGEVTGRIEVGVADITLPATPALSSAFLSVDGRESIHRELLRNRVMPGASPAELGDALLSDPGLGAVDAGFFSGADRDTCEMSPPPTPAEVADAVRGAPPGALVYNYTADEIDECADRAALTPMLQEWARNLHRAGVRQLVTVPPDPALFDDGAGGAGVDIWAILPKDFDAGRAEEMRRAGRGMQLWSYTALSQDDYSPKWLVNHSPLNFRVMPGFINQSLGFTGLLYWRVDNWGPDPWHTAGLYEGRYPGDGMLVYPGDEVGMPGGAAPSIRLKWVRDGVEDYGYAELARNAAGPAAVTDVVRSVAPDWRNWTKDPAELLTARQELAELAASRAPR